MVVEEGQTAPTDQEMTLPQDHACLGRDLHVTNIVFYQSIIKIFWSKGDSTAGGGKHTSHCREISTLPQKLAGSHPDLWVLNTVQSYRMEFLSELTQRSCPKGGDITFRAEPHKGEVQKLQSKGAVAEFFWQKQIEVSTEPIPSAKNGRKNEASDEPKMPQQVCCPSTLQDGQTTHTQGLTQKERWMTKLDLKDAFFMIPIHSSSGPALCFPVQNHFYQFTCLPFGLSCAPRVFTKTLKTAQTCSESWE